MTKQVFQNRQQKARVADQEARGSKPIPSHCHGNTNQTWGDKLWQEENWDWDDDGNTEKGRWLKLPLQADWKLNVLFLLKELQKVRPEGNFYPKLQLKVVMQMRQAKYTEVKRMIKSLLHSES